MSISEEEAAAVAAKMIPPRRPSATREENSFYDDDASGTSGGNEYDPTHHLPPGRINAVKGHHRLHGSNSNLTLLMDSTSTSSGGPGTPRSRSRSPSWHGRRDETKISSNTTTTHDANSSISSLDDYDSDILTDRAGTLDELSESQRKLHGSFKELHLPATVVERMTEDSLEDSHAFTDVVRCFSSNASRVSHVSGSNAGDGMLEPLDECDEGLEENSSLEEDPDDDYVEHLDGIQDEDADNHHHAAVPQTTVILTNMENLTLAASASASVQDDYSNVALRTGESSVAHEQPTA